jgi:hypothetical protein
MSLRKVGLILGITLAFTTRAAAAQTTTGFLKGEQTTGTTKQCFYDALGSAYTVTVSSIAICKQTIQIQTRSSPSPNTPSLPVLPRPSTITAFKTGEQTTGTTKQCYYDGLGNIYTKTVNSIALCPLTIQVTR